MSKPLAVTMKKPQPNVNRLPTVHIDKGHVQVKNPATHAGKLKSC